MNEAVTISEGSLQEKKRKGKRGTSLLLFFGFFFGGWIGCGWRIANMVVRVMCMAIGRGRVYITTKKCRSLMHDSVIVMDMDGKHLQTWERPQHRFCYLFGIASAAGSPPTVFVSDNNRIQAFRPDGSLFRTKSLSFLPRSLTVALEKLYVADCKNMCVHAFGVSDLIPVFKIPLVGVSISTIAVVGDELFVQPTDMYDDSYGYGCIFSARDGTPLRTFFDVGSTWAVAISPVGELCFLEDDGHRLRWATPDGNTTCSYSIKHHESLHDIAWHENKLIGITAEGKLRVLISNKRKKKTRPRQEIGSNTRKNTQHPE